MHGTGKSCRFCLNCECSSNIVTVKVVVYIVVVVIVVLLVLTPVEILT